MGEAEAVAVGWQRLDNIPVEKRKKLGPGPGKPKGIVGLNKRLRALALELAETGSDVVRKKVMLTMEAISLLYAARKQNGADFREQGQLAVDIGGYKAAGAEKAKHNQKKKAQKESVRSDMMRRQALMEREAQAGSGPEEF